MPVALHNIMVLMIEQDVHAGIGRCLVSTDGLIDQKRGPVPFLYPPDIHKPDAGTAGVGMGGVSGKSQILKNSNRKTIPGVTDSDGGNPLHLSQIDLDGSRRDVLTGVYGIGQQVAQYMGEILLSDLSRDRRSQAVEKHNFVRDVIS